MNVPDFLNPRKEIGVTVSLGLIIVLVALASFGLGRLSARGSATSGLKVIYPEGMKAEVMQGSVAAAISKTSKGASTNASSTVGSEQVVASKSGTKYHYPWCAGAKSIREENKIYFANPAEARAAGYEPAANCKGLQ